MATNTDRPISNADPTDNGYSGDELAFASAVALAVIMGVVELAVGWRLPVPGGSLVVPTIVVGVIAVAFTGMGWIILSVFHVRSAQLTFVVLSIVVGIAATWFTYAFSWPVQMSRDSGATPNAEAALVGVPPNTSRCTIITTGAVGPLRAPYRRCATNSPHPGSVVFYYAQTDPGTGIASGIVFNEGPVNDLSDQCVRHLVGEWYAFTSDPAGLTGYNQCFPRA